RVSARDDAEPVFELDQDGVHPARADQNAAPLPLPLGEARPPPPDVVVTGALFLHSAHLSPDRPRYAFLAPSGIKARPRARSGHGAVGRPPGLHRPGGPVHARPIRTRTGR